MYNNAYCKNNIHIRVALGYKVLDLAVYTRNTHELNLSINIIPL